MLRLLPLFSLLSTIVLAGCANWGPQVQSAGPGTLTVTAEDQLKWNAATVPAREVVFGVANDYCAKRKLVMVPVSLDVRPGEIGLKAGSADLVFRALQPGDPAIARSQAVFRQYDPMVVRESIVRFNGDGSPRSVTPQ
jgi:hypothetical protein